MTEFYRNIEKKGKATISHNLKIRFYRGILSTFHKISSVEVTKYFSQRVNRHFRSFAILLIFAELSNKCAIAKSSDD